MRENILQQLKLKNESNPIESEKDIKSVLKLNYNADVYKISFEKEQNCKVAYVQYLISFKTLKDLVAI